MNRGRLRNDVFQRKKELSERIVQLRVKYLCSAFDEKVAMQLTEAENEINSLLADPRNYEREVCENAGTAVLRRR